MRRWVRGARGGLTLLSRENLLCLGSGRDLISLPAAPPALRPRPEGHAGPVPRVGQRLAVSTRLLSGLPAPQWHSAPPRQLDKRVWGCNAPLFGAVTQKGRESGWGQVAPHVPEQSPDSPRTPVGTVQETSAPGGELRGRRRQSPGNQSCGPHPACGSGCPCASGPCASVLRCWPDVALQTGSPAVGCQPVPQPLQASVSHL